MNIRAIHDLPQRERRAIVAFAEYVRASETADGHDPDAGWESVWTFVKKAGLVVRGDKRHPEFLPEMDFSWPTFIEHAQRRYGRDYRKMLGW